MNACVNMFYFSYVSFESLELKYLQEVCLLQYPGTGYHTTIFWALIVVIPTADSYEGSMKALVAWFFDLRMLVDYFI